MVFVGIRRAALALDERTGDELWRTDLSGSDYVTVRWDGEGLYAANNGEVFRLDPGSGAIVWHNKLKGHGRGLVSLASSRRATSMSDAAPAKKRHDEQSAAASAVT